MKSRSERILPRFPNYDRAIDVEEVDAKDIDPESFRKLFIEKNKPFIARGAAKHWAACQDWSLGSLKGKLEGVEDLYSQSQGMLTQPLREYAGDNLAGDERREVYENRPQGEDASALKFLEKIEKGEKVTAYGVSFDTEGLDELKSDIGSLPFLPKPLETKHFLYYPRAFLYSGGYTDWHFHYSDETVTVQAAGKKEFMLLPTDSKTFDTMWDISRDKGFWEEEALNHPDLQDVIPLRACLEPGDAIYIPVFWWHAVEPLTEGLGATLAFTQKTPAKIQFDLRYAANRWNLQQACVQKGAAFLIPFILLGAVSAYIRHPFAAPHLESARSGPAEQSWPFPPFRSFLPS